MFKRKERMAFIEKGKKQIRSCMSGAYDRRSFLAGDGSTGACGTTK